MVIFENHAMKNMSAEPQATSRRRRKAFLPPGQFDSPAKTAQALLRVCRYNDAECETSTPEPAGLAKSVSQNVVTWIDVEGLEDPDTLRAVGAEFHLHPLVLEDIAETSHRPKLEEHEGYLFLLAKRLRFEAESTRILVRHVGLVFLPNVVLTFHERGDDPFAPLRERIEQHRGMIRTQQADYLLHALLDTLVDEYFIALEDVETVADALESAVQHATTGAPLRKIHHLRRQGIRFRRNARPMRDISSALARNDVPLLGRDVGVYMRDLHDHCIQIIDAAETLRDTLSVLLDLQLSTVSNRMNATMQTLTIVATIFIPLTFIAGVYGMNFKYMPELDFQWGYPAALGLMLVVAVGMLLFFRTRKWM
jgi:magnesium transporter